MDTLELLAPAGSAEIGIAAVNHGADAVYIGAPAFGARAAAGNSLADIERLVRHAHLFRAKVYIAINTILQDDELEKAAALCHRLYQLGADALIIQDMGLLECELPPLPLHASTQMDSGQCYISEVMAGRSANRGKCAQFCRHKFDLRRNSGELLAKERYLLSLQDLNLSGKLRLLCNAGVRSFKIEGRLKDENYVKNVTAAYRKELDAILDTGDFAPASSGHCSFSFTSDIEKSFHRGKTDYFLLKKRNDAAEIRSPKATGAPVGRVAKTAGKTLWLENSADIIAGDGLCFFTAKGLSGFRVNRVDKEKIMVKELQQSTSPRKIRLYGHCRQQRKTLTITINDEDNISSTTSIQIVPEVAKKPRQGYMAAYRQLVKTGGTPFVMETLEVTLQGDPFLLTADLNRLRRTALENHQQQRLAAYTRQHIPFSPSSIPWIRKTISTLDNIGNTRTIQFFQRHGVSCKEKVQDFQPAKTSFLPLMQTRYCIKFQLGICPKVHGQKGIADSSLILSDRQGRYKLTFHCQRCEMVLQILP